MSFRFEKLLSFRKNQVYQAYRSVSSIKSKINNHRESLNLSTEIEKLNRQKFNQLIQNKMDINTRRLFDKYFENQKKVRKIKFTALDKLSIQHENLQAELISLIKKTKILENLKLKKVSMPINNRSYEENFTICRGQFS